MKRISRRLALPLLLAALSLLATDPALAQLEAGAATREITPDEFPVNLVGGFSPAPTETVHDSLQARALAFRNGEGRAVIAILDVIGMPVETAEAIKSAAAAETGWSPGEMLLAGTHTHSAPSVGAGGSGPQHAFHLKAVAGGVAAIVEAVSRLEPAQVAFASDEVPDEVNNRRWFLEEGTMAPNPFGEIDLVRMNPPRQHIVKPAGPTDPEVAVISLRRGNRRPFALFSNYALHYVGNIPGRGVSADYFGEFARIAPYRTGGNPPEDFVAMLSNAASGDINNIDFRGTRPPRGPFEQIRQVATKVADASWRALREAEYTGDAAVAMRERRVPLAYRKPSPETLAEARRILTLSEAELQELPRLANHYAARSIRLAEGPDELEAVIQAIRIGDQAIVSFPFEVLVEIGLEIKERSPFPRTLVISHANGSYGYLPTPEQHALGGYETWLGTCRVQEDASVILTDQLLEMLEELKSE